MEHYTITIFNMAVNLDTLITMWLCMGLIIITAFLCTRKLTLVPSKPQFIMEKFMGFIWGLTDSMMGHEGKKHTPFIASLFIFILISNLCGQLPWRLYHLKHGELASPTNDLNVTGALAIIVLVYYVVSGIAKKKFKFFLHGTSIADIILFLVEILEMVTRPLTLALRLFGNVFAGEILILAFIGICAYIVPLPMMIFELLVALIQTLVFTMLTMVYIGTAVNEEH